MKVGICEAQQLKERSEELGLSFAEMLWGYMVEDAMLRIYASAYREHLWLVSRNVLGADSYQRRTEESIHFLYQPSERMMAKEKLCPGQRLSAALCEQMVQDIFAKEDDRQINWSAEVSEEKGVCRIYLTGMYKEMQVPFCLAVHSVDAPNQRPGRQEIDLTVMKNHRLSYLEYAPENQLSRDLFEIINKLELIGDMGCYHRVYQMLCREPLSGRYVLEELNALTESSPKVRKEQRIGQLAEYRNYTYMRKRWEKYVRNRNVGEVAWEDLLQLLLQFLTPVWHSLCCNEIFFDDWMPELGRFLG